MKIIWPTKRNLIFKVSGKTAAKSLADGVVQLAILCIYIRMIVYDSATVNIVKISNSKNHIIRLSSPRFLVVAFFVVRAEFQAAVKCCLET